MRIHSTQWMMWLFCAFIVIERVGKYVCASLALLGEGRISASGGLYNLCVHHDGRDHDLNEALYNTHAYKHIES